MKRSPSRSSKPAAICGIYGIYCTVTDRWYVGQSVNIFGQRLPQHVRDLERKFHCNDELLRDFIKHGIENFTLQVLCRCRKTQLDQYEDYYIYKMGAYYNKLWSCGRPIVRLNGRMNWKDDGRPPAKKPDNHGWVAPFSVLGLAVILVIALVFG